MAIAATVWATYAATLGYVFGQAFEDDHTLAFWLAFGTALAITPATRKLTDNKNIKNIFRSVNLFTIHRVKWSGSAVIGKLKLCRSYRRRREHLCYCNGLF